MDACEHIREELSAYLDGELSSDARAACETHLVSCAACRAELEDLRAAGSAVAGLPKLRAPASLAARIRQDVAKQPAPQDSSILDAKTAKTPAAAAAFSLWRPALLGIAALIVLSVFAFVMMPALSGNTYYRSADSRGERRTPASPPAVAEKTAEPASRAASEPAPTPGAAPTVSDAKPAADAELREENAATGKFADAGARKATNFGAKAPAAEVAQSTPPVPPAAAPSAAAPAPVVAGLEPKPTGAAYKASGEKAAKQRAAMDAKEDEGLLRNGVTANKEALPVEKSVVEFRGKAKGGAAADSRAGEIEQLKGEIGAKRAELADKSGQAKLPEPRQVDGVAEGKPALTDAKKEKDAVLSLVDGPAQKAERLAGERLKNESAVTGGKAAAAGDDPAKAFDKDAATKGNRESAAARMRRGTGQSVGEQSVGDEGVATKKPAAAAAQPPAKAAPGAADGFDEMKKAAVQELSKSDAGRAQMARKRALGEEEAEVAANPDSTKAVAQVESKRSVLKKLDEAGGGGEREDVVVFRTQDAEGLVRQLQELTKQYGARWEVADARLAQSQVLKQDSLEAGKKMQQQQRESQTGGRAGAGYEIVIMPERRLHLLAQLRLLQQGGQVAANEAAAPREPETAKAEASKFGGAVELPRGADRKPNEEAARQEAPKPAATTIAEPRRDLGVAQDGQQAALVQREARIRIRIEVVVPPADAAKEAK